MHVLSVVGARPQFVKLAPIDRALRAADVQHTIVHTGQHYDPSLSDIFFDELRISPPEVHLGVGSGSHGAQTAAMLAALETVLDERRPDWTLVYGDTNSTLAAALAAVKLHLPIAHLEAGLRSFNRLMPEEHNRVLTDHAADLCLAPTEVAMEHLAREGLAERSVNVGDVMTDVCLATRDEVLAGRGAGLPGVEGDYLLATIHRAENTDDPDRLRSIIEGLRGCALPVVLLVHPRLRARCEAQGIRLGGGSLHAHEPLGYPDLVAAALGSAGVVTDSGGLQKEAFLLGVPCTTVRTETEWVETLDGGWNKLVQDPAQISAVASRARPTAGRGTPYGDGHAAERVAQALFERRMAVAG